MVLEDPLYQDGNDYPARLDRQFIEDVFDTEGVIKPATGALAVSVRGAGANMSVDVAAGRAVIKGDDEANQGSYRVLSTAVENLPIGAAPGSDSRIDLVVARVRDSAVTGGVSKDWLPEVIPGEVAVDPVAPAVPNTAIPLAQVLVATGTLSITAGMITDRRTAAGNAAYVAKATPTLAYAQVTANQAGITAEVDLAGLSVAPTVEANRRVRVTAFGQVAAGIAAAAFRGQLYQDGAIVGRWLSSPSTPAGERTTGYGAVILTPSGGSHTYKATLQVVSGSGSATLEAAAGVPAYILVEDIGAAS
jgi:hypothetical protein